MYQALQLVPAAAVGCIGTYLVALAGSAVRARSGATGVAAEPTGDGPVLGDADPDGASVNPTGA